LKKSINPFEAAGMLAAPFIAYWGFSFVQTLIMEGLGGAFESADSVGAFVLGLFATALVPSFVSAFLAALPQSGRYRIVNSFLAIYAILFMLLRWAFRVVDGFAMLLLMSIHFAVALLAAWLALKCWSLIRASRKPRAAAAAAASPGPLAAAPRPSLFLVALAVANIPLVPILILATVLITGGAAASLWLVLEAIPRIPVVLLFGAMAAPAVALWVAIKSIAFILRPPPSFQPAVRLDLNERPRLAAMVADVAGKAGARAPSHVILHFNPTFFAARGRMRLLDGEVSGDILGLGAPVLAELKEAELKAVLAHEFAHFSGNDVLYSTVVAPVYRGIGAALSGLTGGGGEGVGAVVRILSLPAALFLASFHEFFSTIDAAMSRDRELRADRMAAELYGKAALTGSLQSVAVTASLFGKKAETLRPSEPEGFISAFRDSAAADQEGRMAVLAELAAAGAHALDTHPTNAARAAALPELAGSESGAPAAGFEPLDDDERRLSALVVQAFSLPLAGDEQAKADKSGEPSDNPKADPEDATPARQ
jgi:Zn-dependent protease with chaperone function